MYEAHTFTREEEEALLSEWFETVQFDEESEGVPALENERDDEEPQSRSVELSGIDMDVLMTELRKREPDNPF